MSDDRTTAQKAADEGLREAIKASIEAYNDDDALAWLPTEYVVVYSMQAWDDDGDALSAVGTAVYADTTPIHRLLGLTEYASAHYRRMIGDDV